MYDRLSRTPIVLQQKPMSVLIFRLRHVPEEEADAIRSLLDESQIDWFETTAGNWGIAMPGLWVKEDKDVQKARSIIDDYQQTLSITQRKLYEERQQAGEVSTFTQRIAQHPFRIAVIFLFCLFILYVSIHPFMQMIGYTSQ